MPRKVQYAHHQASQGTAANLKYLCNQSLFRRAVYQAKIKRWQSGHTQKFSLADFNKIVKIFEAALKGE